MTLPLIPSWLLSSLCFLFFILAFPAIYRIPYLSRERLITMLVIGIIYIALSMVVYGSIYYYFTTYIVDADLRQICIRFANLFLLLTLDGWIGTISIIKGSKSIVTGAK